MTCTGTRKQRMYIFTTIITIIVALSCYGFVSIMASLSGVTFGPSDIEFWFIVIAAVGAWIATVNGIRTTM